MRRDSIRRIAAAHVIAAGALLTGAFTAQAQTSVEVSFYYPVAVGGPIAKTIDGFAQGFMKDNPTIKVTPIYAGTYQETIVKACCSRQTCSR